MWHIVIPSDDILIMIKNVFDEIYIYIYDFQIFEHTSSDQ